MKIHNAGGLAGLLPRRRKIPLAGLFSSSESPRPDDMRASSVNFKAFVQGTRIKGASRPRRRA